MIPIREFLELVTSPIPMLPPRVTLCRYRCRFVIFRMNSVKICEQGVSNMPSFPILRAPRCLAQLLLETGRLRFRRARFQTPNSVIFFLALTELRGENSVSSSHFFCSCAKDKLTEFFAELTEFAAELSEISSPKQHSRNSIPLVSYRSCSATDTQQCQLDFRDIRYPLFREGT